jgi:hypothetical protein
MEDASLTRPKTLNPEPKRAMVRNESVLPIDTKSKTLIDDASLKNPAAEHDDPMRTKQRTDTELPMLA